MRMETMIARVARAGLSTGLFGESGRTPRRRAGVAAVRFLWVVLLIGATGCPPPVSSGVNEGSRDPLPPRDTAAIVAAIRENAAKLNRALWSDTIHVTAHLIDADGLEHVQNLDGNLLFVQPRRLRMDLRHGLGTPVMQIGSNDEQYWFWIEPELKGMWWGRHRFVGRPCVGRMAVRPDQLVSALGLGGLPVEADGLSGPMRVSGNRSDLLYYWNEGPEGAVMRVRQYRVSRTPPYLVRLVSFLDGFGRKTMIASLDDYAPAWEGGPRVAHSIVVDWPLEGGRFTITIDRLRGESSDRLRAGWFDRPTGDRLPAGVRSNVVQVDAECE